MLGVLGLEVTGEGGLGVEEETPTDSPLWWGHSTWLLFSKEN